MEGGAHALDEESKQYKQTISRRKKYPAEWRNGTK
jgi:hypothetical protein